MSRQQIREQVLMQNTLAAPLLSVNDSDARESVGNQEPVFAIQMFGSIAVHCHGHLIPKMRTRKELWLLALLVLNAAGRPMERLRLAGMLWPESVDSAALYNLRRSLGVLRDALGAEAGRIVAPTPRTLQIEMTGAVCDVIAFDIAIRQGSEPSLVRAVDLYEGALLRDCMEDWVTPERAMRQEAVLVALETLARHARERGDLATTVQRLQRALDIDPLRETAVRSLMEAMAEQGGHAAAGVVFRDFRLRLHHELNANPAPETVRLHQQIHAAGRDHAARPVGRQSDPISLPRVNRDVLPIFLSVFLGRATDLIRVQDALMQGAHRLLTISGPGGVGKTRLAVEASRLVEDSFAGGVFFMDCTVLPRGADSERLWQAVAASLFREPERNGKPAPTKEAALHEMVIGFFQNGPTLLILDNLEHLIPVATALIIAILSECPLLTVLVTSRVVLNLPGEGLLSLEPLPLPKSETLAAAEESDAVLLFVQRAQGVRPDIMLNQRTVAAITTICRLTDGLPLALELAASRLRLFSLHDLMLRLADPLRILSGSEAIPPRQRSLDRLIEWSYVPLLENQKMLFQAISVFPDAFTLEAAEAVSGISDAIDALSGLVDASLVQVTEDSEGSTRYRLLETIRTYAAARLQESGDTAAVRRRFGLWARGWMELAYEGLWGQEGGDWLRRIARELTNLQAALEAGETQDALYTAHRLDQFWWRTNRFREGISLFNRVMAKPGGNPYDRSACRMSAEQLKDILGEPNQRLEALVEGIAICKERGSLDSVVFLRNNQGLLLGGHGRYEEAIEALNDGLAHAVGLENPFLIGYIRRGMAEVRVEQGAYEEALADAIAALDIFREMDRTVHSTHALLHIGQALIGLDRFSEADQVLSESLSLARHGEMKDLELELLVLMGDSAQSQGDVDAARALYQKVLTLTEKGGPHKPIQQAQDRLARLDMSSGNSSA